MVNAISKKGKKEAKAMLQKIKGTVVCVDDPDKRGRYIREFTRSKSQKDRKNDGWVEARLVHPQMKYKDVHEEAIEPVKFYDSWAEAHDGLKWNTSTDQLHHKWEGFGNKEDIYEKNRKIIKQIKIRKARQKTKNKHNI
jgi:hypothetical protein